MYMSKAGNVGHCHFSSPILLQYNHPWLHPGNAHYSFAIICAKCDGVPISFPLGNDRHALVTSLRLSLRFRFSEEFMYIDKGSMMHTLEI
jgi:hypothetical protein